MNSSERPVPPSSRLTEAADRIRAERPNRLRDALDLIRAALEAVDPEAATRRSLHDLGLGSETMTIIALGKAAPAMARGAVGVLGSGARSILVVTDHDEPVPDGTELIVSSHPVPDGRSLAAGLRMLDLVTQSPHPILFLISGGGSALAEVPAEGLELEDVAATFQAILRSGMSIEDANVIRAHISRLKGGRLAAATRQPVATILISDVGPDPHLVASGPTVQCTSTPADALDIIHRHRLDVPDPVLASLADGRGAPPLADSPTVMAADGTMAAEAAVDAGRRRNLPIQLLTSSLDGEAGTAMRECLDSFPRGEIAVLAGETTVEVRGDGVGGRNQEAALAAVDVLAGTATSVLTFGTDGVDGPTDAAGAYVDGTTRDRLSAAGIDIDSALARNDSHTALAAVDALVRTGPTGVNVADIWIIDRRDL